MNTRTHTPYHLMTPAAIRRLLGESIHWPIEKLQELQWAKLEVLLNFAYDTNPFYHERMVTAGLHPRRDFRGLECLSKLPILTKEDVRSGLQRMCSTDPNVKGPAINASGGSTGIPLRFYQDENYRNWANAARYRAWRTRDGVPSRGIQAVLWGADQDVGREISFRARCKEVVVHRELSLNTFDLDVQRVRRYFRLYNLIRPTTVRGYASSLDFIAQIIESEKLQIHRPQVVLSSAETLWPAMRKRISRVFGADVIDSYGCREVSQIATECSAHAGLHLAMENQYVELVDGRIIVTNLNNHYMPFLRYEIGDLAEQIGTERCACGQQSHRLMGLQGRVCDVIELPSGKKVHGEFFTHLFYDIEVVRRFQVVYFRSQELLQINLLCDHPSDTLAASLVERIRQTLQFQNVNVTFTEQLHTSPSGKFRFVFCAD